MKRADLEGMLEGGLTALGSTLSRRVYFEELVVGAEIDDHFSDITTEDLMKDRAYGWYENGTPVQREVAEGIDEGFAKFFERKSDIYQGIKIEYRLYSNRENPRAIDSDEIISNGEIDGESVDILSMDGDFFLGINIEYHQGKYRVLIDTREDWLEEKGVTNKAEKLVRMDGSYLEDVGKVYQAIMDILK